MSTNNNERPIAKEPERKPYIAPAIILELDLETRAGSVLPTGIDPLDLTGLGTDDVSP